MSKWAEQVAARITGNPLGGHLGFEMMSATADQVAIRMPFRKQHVTLGEQVHGGAIAALIDTAATAVAWAGVDPKQPPSRGATVNLEVSYMSSARSVDLIATATTPKRGRNICFCHVDVHDPEGTLVAQGRAIYKTG